jgi:ubiquinone/menaquinone biosynthesis C-methylase UbiE
MQRYLLFQYGLTPQSSLVDVGCGSGRLAVVLRDLLGLRYLGIDVVDDLLQYAAEIANRRDWVFKKSINLEIPAVDNSQDMVCAFSVFTHLLHEETYLYLKEIKRVLKPRGRCVFSFLDFSVPAHWTVFETNLENVNQRSVLNQFMDSGAIRAWCQHLGFEVLAIHPGSEPHIQLPDPVQFEDGSVMTGKGSMGQSVCVIQK